ncbi:MAG: hypothetical protein ACR2OA_16155, partial [Rubripirellula sp.]
RTTHGEPPASSRSRLLDAFGLRNLSKANPSHRITNAHTAPRRTRQIALSSQRRERSEARRQPLFVSGGGY